MKTKRATIKRLEVASPARQLAELEHLYRTAPVGLCFVDRDLRYLHINERMAAMNGKPASEHIGRTVQEVIPGVALEVANIYRRVIETGEPALDFEVITSPRSGELGGCEPPQGRPISTR